MKPLLVIVGMGEGNGLAIARRFAKEGFRIAMLARNEAKLRGYQQTLETEGFTARYFLADAGDKNAIITAFTAIDEQMGVPDVLVYNAAVLRIESVLETSFDSLVSDFQTNVAGALLAAQRFVAGLQKAQKTGTLLLTGGGFALYPQPEFASLAIGKAGIRSLAITLGMALKPNGITVGTITICGTVVDDPNSKYNPMAIAEEYWKFYAHPPSEFEVVY